MKNKVYVITLGVLVVALVLYIVFRDTNKIQYELPTIESFDKEQVTKILYQKGEGSGEKSITLEKTLKKQEGKQDETWRIMPEGYPSDSSKVEQILTTLTEFRPVDLVSDKKAYEKYSLNEGDRISVTAFDDEKKLLDFYIGKDSSSGRYTYIKLPDDPNVYSARGDIKRRFIFEEEQLRDKQVLSFNDEHITRITFESAEGLSTEGVSSEGLSSEGVPEKGGETGGRSRKGDGSAATGKKTVLTKLLAEEESVSVGTSDGTSGGSDVSQSTGTVGEGETGKEEEKAEKDASQQSAAEFVWKKQDGTKVENQEVDDWLSRMSILKCKNFKEIPPGAEKLGTITLTDVSDKRYTLTLYEKDDEGYPAESSQTDYGFYLSSYLGETIIDFFK